MGLQRRPGEGQLLLVLEDDIVRILLVVHGADVVDAVDIAVLASMIIVLIVPILHIMIAVTFIVAVIARLLPLLLVLLVTRLPAFFSFFVTCSHSTWRLRVVWLASASGRRRRPRTADRCNDGWALPAGSEGRARRDVRDGTCSSGARCRTIVRTTPQVLSMARPGGARAPSLGSVLRPVWWPVWWWRPRPAFH